MSSEPVKNESANKRAEAIFDAIGKLIIAFFRITTLGVKRIPWKSGYFYGYLFLGTGVLYTLALRAKHLDVFYWFFHYKLTLLLIQYLLTFDPLYHFAVLAVVALFAFLVCLGIRPFREWERLQKAINHMALKSGLGSTPKLIRIRNDGPHRTKLTILSEGIGTDRYETKIKDLEAAFDCAVESIRTAESPKYIEISLAKRRIPQECKYTDQIGKLTKPYSFIVGESIGGFIMQCIRDLPHMLIAGTTGKGKSVFFKQVILSLIRTSSFIQLYLLDLKRGVETKDFRGLPNVVIAKDEQESVNVLQKIKAEMDRRFVYLEEKGHKKIEPTRDEMDLIVLVVDEASELYTLPSRKSEKTLLIQEARELTDQIAKLGRAAAIHLILATQKVTKETIDTRIQENIGGRICFRVNTLQNSMTMLGNKMAFELADKPGRAIWSVGNEFSEVQTPLLTDDDIKRECEVIKFEYEKAVRKNFQPLLTVPVQVNKSKPDVAEVSGSLKVAA